MTVLVRAAAAAADAQAVQVDAALAALAPEIKKLQEKYKNDKERLNQEMMRFYRENKVNPFASCLPLVAQLPVFLSLFYMLRTDLRLRHLPGGQPARHAEPACRAATAATRSFLFIPDLTDRRTGWVLVVLIVLYVGSQLASTLLMSTTTDRTQRMIFLALPFFFVIFVIQFPAGLLVYWITTNLWTIVQQAIIRKRLGPMRPPGQEQESLGDLIRKLERRRRRPGRRAGTQGDGKAAKAPKATRRRRSPAARRRAGRAGRRPRRRGARRSAPGGGDERAGQRPEDPVDRVREVLETVADALGLDAEVDVEENDEGIRGVLEGDDLGLFIGRHGQTIDAVQHLAFKIANRDGGRSGVRVAVDAAGYRERREQVLHRQADQAALDAVRGRRPVALDAMSATERKVVHEYLKDRDDVETYSEGTEPDRHLVVAPLQP